MKIRKAKKFTLAKIMESVTAELPGIPQEDYTTIYNVNGTINFVVHKGQVISKVQVSSEILGSKLFDMRPIRVMDGDTYTISFLEPR